MSNKSNTRNQLIIRSSGRQPLHRQKAGKKEKKKEKGRRKREKRETTERLETSTFDETSTPLVQYLTIRRCANYSRDNITLISLITNNRHLNESRGIYVVSNVPYRASYLERHSDY